MRLAWPARRKATDQSTMLSLVLSLMSSITTPISREGTLAMPANPVLWDLDERGVATVTLNRPEVNNAYDAALIGGVLSAMDELGQKPNLRIVVLKGDGKHFQA